MPRVLPALASLGFLLIAAPVGAWSAGGGAEPDTGFDRRSFMFFDSDRDPRPLEKVYFNVVMGSVSSSPNPNLGTLSSAMLLPGAQTPVAYLGVWKDCNGDGYVGSAESGLEVYSSAALVGPYDTGICPLGQEHNKEGWVYEFRWIGDVSSAPETAVPRMIHDPFALVWGDWGDPWEFPAQPRRAPDFTFRFEGNVHDEDTRRGCVRAADCPPTGTPPLPPDTPGLLGLHRPTASAAGPGWRVEGGVHGTPSLVQPRIKDGEDPRTFVDFESSRYLTFYAHVTSYPTRQLPGEIGHYGSSQCGSQTSGVHGNFHCSPTDWAGPVKVGTSYQLRDVDCFDGKLAGEVRASLTDLSNGGPCFRP